MPAGQPGAPRLRLTSTANPRVRELLSLRKRAVRDRLGLTLLDGRDELALALDAGVRPRTLYFCPELAATSGDLSGPVAAAGGEVIELSRLVFERVAYRQSPDGYLAVLPAVRTGLAELTLTANPLLLVCEAVEKPGNLGAMLRTADAAGLDAVISAGPVTDWGNPNTIRASKGTLFTVPVAAADSAQVLDWLAARPVRIVATTPAASVAYTDVDFRGPTAIVVGSETRGLSTAWLDRAHVRVNIPMVGAVNSLNVATSAALVAYEAIRQRQAPGWPAGDRPDQNQHGQSQRGQNQHGAASATDAAGGRAR
jgi:TrmH family RNA methyltransferase